MERWKKIRSIVFPTHLENPLLHQIFIPSSLKVNSLPPPYKIKIFKLYPNKNVIFSCSHSCTIFVLTSYSF